MSVRAARQLLATGVLAALVIALSGPGLAGEDGQKPPAAKPPENAPAKKDAKPAEKPPAPVVASPVAALRPAPTSLDDAMRRLSRVRVSVTLKETPFTEAVDYIRRVSGFNVMVSPILQNKGLDGVPALTMSLRDISLRQFSELVAKITQTRFKFEDGILQFTTPQDARGKPVLRIYAIGDVTMRLRNFPGPDINLRPSGSEFEQEEESEVDHAWSDPQKIVDMIQKMVAQDTWDDEDVAISADENKLIVKQYAEVHREIGRLIALLRAAR